MWECRNVSSEIWHSYHDQVSEPSLAKLKAYIKDNFSGLMPLTPVGNNTFRTAGGTWEFRFTGTLSDYEAPSVKMTPDFTLDELEEAKSFIAKIS